MALAGDAPGGGRFEQSLVSSDAPPVGEGLLVHVCSNELLAAELPRVAIRVFSDAVPVLNA
jgi:hypothetical protein